MPDLNLPAGYGLVTHRFEGPALPTGAVVTYGVDLQGFAGDLSDAAVALYNALQTEWVNTTMGGATRHLWCRVKEGPVSTGLAAEYSGEGISDGGAVLAPNTAFLFTKETALGGRKGKGRLFMPGVGEGVVDNGGVITEATFPTLAGKVASWNGEINSLDLPMVLLHYNATAPTPVTNLQLASKVASQRKRLRR